MLKSHCLTKNLTLNETRSDDRCWFKDCEDDTDTDYCCMKAADPIPTDDDDFEDDENLDQYDVESLLGVGATLLVLGTLIGIVAAKTKKEKKRKRRQGGVARGNDETAPGAQTPLIQNSHPV